MEQIKTTIKNMLELMGFADFKIDIDEAERHGTIFISDNYEFIKNNLSSLVENFNLLLRQIAINQNLPVIHFDINNYRKEREKIITELAKAAAKKAVITSQEITLPPMNAYERRLVHVELSMHPDVKTESLGEGESRRVSIKPIKLTA